MTIPTLQELSDQNLAGFEAALGQRSPLAEKAFLRVLAIVEALQGLGLYKLALERSRQTLAITATGADLDLIGAEYSTIRKPAESTVLTVTLPATDGTEIPITSLFIGTPNGVQYYMSNAEIAAGGIATISLTADQSGTIGNLQVGDRMTIVSAVPGATSTATVTAITNTGAEGETDTAYRPRVLFAERAITGGSNATDHKIWAEEIAGVRRAFPFAGKPVGSGTSYPGDRTVYVECDATVQADGIAPGSLLDEVRASINTDPSTGMTRTALGLTDDTLYVEAITRTVIDVAITGFISLAGTEVAVKDAITAALASYLLSIFCYVEGVDLPQDRNDLITALTLSDVVQNVLTANGASATGVTFEVAATPYTSYQLEPGELIKLGVVTYP